jgi:hypothetical protein
MPMEMIVQVYHVTFFFLRKKINFNFFFYINKLALFNAALGNVLGIFLSPALMTSKVSNIFQVNNEWIVV